MESYKVINEFISKIKSNEIEVADSIRKLIAGTNFTNNLKVIDKIFFNNKLQEIDSINYIDTISFINDIHEIKSGLYNDFNIWSASKSHLRKSRLDLIERHEELNKIVGFPDNGNGLYKSFLGSKNLLTYIKNKFKNSTKNTSVLAKDNEIRKNENKDHFNIIKQIPFDINKFSDACKKSGLVYTTQLITRFVASLTTKPFVILSGLSGSGKTKLAEAFAKWICESEKQYCIVPVGADWTNREPLLGYVNALNQKEYILPENKALELIIKANSDENKPYFLILDEMNLSHVERYFADFLSVMETKDKFKLHSSKLNLNIADGKNFKDSIEVPSESAWPKNLFIIGTVNIDETTYMFSPKVLDRANVIEFRVSKDQLTSFFDSKIPLDLKKLYEVENDNGFGLGSKYSIDFLKIAFDEIKNKNLAIVNLEPLNTELKKFFGELQKVGAEFGYRSASEIQTLFSKIDLVNPEYSAKTNDKIDIAIMQKLLPKLHGSRSKLIDVLKVLGNLCVASKGLPKEKQDDIFKTIKDDNLSIIYPISLEKIERMYDNVIANGFTSYAEA